MKIKLTVSICSLILRLGVAHAQEMSPVEYSMSQVSTAGTAPQSVQPSTPAPDMQPPAPPQQPPAPPVQAQSPSQAQQPAGPAQAAGGGQWVYTSEYGWIWMPYGNQYTYEGAANDAYPYSYVYYPSYGWTWLAAPWVWGWGPYPYFGPRGPGGFGWYVDCTAPGTGGVDTAAVRAGDTDSVAARALVVHAGVSGGGSRGHGGGHGGGHR